jgi:hypothetical protein
MLALNLLIIAVVPADNLPKDVHPSALCHACRAMGGYVTGGWHFCEREPQMSSTRLFILAIFLTAPLCGCVGVPCCTTGVPDYCDQCDACPSHPIPCTPLDGLRQAHRSLICSAGCGEVYYGEWASSPPLCCDPCDDCGQWVDGCEQRCLPCVRLPNLMHVLFGYRLRCDDTPSLIDICAICHHECCTGCCDSCSDCCGVEDQGEYYEGESVIDGVMEDVGDGEMYEELPPGTSSQFRPIPGTRRASAMSAGYPRTTSKSGCNCGRH